MPYPRLTAAARKGDAQAIAGLIRTGLPAGTKSEARLRNQALQVILTADHRLNQVQTLRDIADIIGPLQLALQSIRIDAYINHETAPVWSETLTSQAPQHPAPPTIPTRHSRPSHPAPNQPIARAPVPNQAQAKHPERGQDRRSTSHIPTWLAEKPNFQTYRALLEANFDCQKLVLVLPFVFYGLFFAKHYNVVDFLYSKIWIIQFMHGVNLIFHEAGHILFMPLGRFMTILGGSLNQILIPTVISGYFFFKQQRYSGAVTLFWVGENFWDVSIYASDGRDTVLPLLSDGLTHDWHWLLSNLGVTAHAELVGSLLYAVGTLIYISAIGLTIYFSQKAVADRQGGPSLPHR